MDDWQCHDKSVRYLWRVLCESINLACVLRFQDKWTTLKHPPSHLQQGESMFVIVYAQLKVGKVKLTRWGITSQNSAPPSPRASSLRSPVCPSPFPAPLPHCTACSLAVLPESWGFMTSGSSGGVEKGSILSCSNESSGRTTERGSDNSEKTEERHKGESKLLLKLELLQREINCGLRTTTTYHPDGKLIPQWLEPEVGLFDLWSHNCQEFDCR